VCSRSRRSACRCWSLLCRQRFTIGFGSTRESWRIVSGAAALFFFPAKCGNMRLVGVARIASATANASKGQVRKFDGSLNSEMPCCSAVLMRLKRRNTTPPACKSTLVDVHLHNTTKWLTGQYCQLLLFDSFCVRAPAVQIPHHHSERRVEIVAFC
jgi:hypothetical protein